MKKYYIQQKTGKKKDLLSLLIEHAHVSEAEARSLLVTGAVWNKETNRRIKNPDMKITCQLIVVYIPAYNVSLYPFEPEDIVYEEEDFLIVYKKENYPAVPTPFSDVISLSYAVGRYFSRTQPGTEVSVINRLDTLTRGLLFCAKNKQTEKKIHQMFRERQVKKWYIAGTEAFPGVKQDYRIHDILEWKRKQKPARTYIRLLKQEPDRYCFFVRLHTGRTHQIRKHFARYLVPLVGDPVYGNSSRHRNPSSGNLSRHTRLALICCAYIFPHPVTGRRMKVTYLPGDLW